MRQNPLKVAGTIIKSSLPTKPQGKQTSFFVFDEASTISKKQIKALHPIVDKMKQQGKLKTFVYPSISTAPGASPPKNNQVHELDGPSRKIVRSLDFWRSQGFTTPTKKQVAMVAGYAPGGGSFLNPLGKMRSNGIIDYPAPGCVSLLVSSETDNMSYADAKDALLGVLDGPKKRIIAAVVKLGGGPIDRAQVAETCDPPYAASGGSFLNPVGSLCTLGLLEKAGAGMIKLADWAKEILN